MIPEGSEWLVTNGLGGYASGTIGGSLRRRYHGYLIAALPAPLGRTVLLTQMTRALMVDRDPEPVDDRHLETFTLVDGLPRWRYRMAGTTLEKRVLMPHGQNTVHISWRVLSGQVRELHLRPVVGFRPHEFPVNRSVTSGYTLTIVERGLEINSVEGIEGVDARLRFLLHAREGDFIVDHLALEDVQYLTEEHRGYEASGALWSPGYFRTHVDEEHEATLVASSEDWTAMDADPRAVEDAEVARRRELVAVARNYAGPLEPGQLVLAADQFVIRPLVRADGEARPEARTIIAGYHWFTDWGRDTMISLEGLTLVTGRHDEAAEILRTFARAERDGLIPNYFPEGDNEGVYHTADATLWFFHAVSRYTAHTGSTALVGELMPVLHRIIDAHLSGTRFGIGVDHRDGLLRQGEQGYQLTWMDAKVDGWVVTPRRGKAVEINALWYNALRLMENWVRAVGDHERASSLAAHADRARASFNRRFWSDRLGHLLDVVDPGDEACRPNQLFAISLEHPVLDETKWQAVVNVVESRLLTPVGLRSLAPGHPDYKPQYFGDLRTRDAAYHQGTVWAWLIGPAVDAWLKTHPGDTTRARKLLDGLIAHLDAAGAGSISEVFDAEPPYTPRGCIAQAWSVAEVLRSLWKINAVRRGDSSSPAGR